MGDRASLREHFSQQRQQADLKAEQKRQFDEQIASLRALENTLAKAFNNLIRFLDGKTTKTEVVNQLKEIATPDVAKVVSGIKKLDETTLSNKIDLKPVVEALKAIQSEIEKVPKKLPELPEQKDSVKVTNLSEVSLDTSALEKAIKGLKLVAEAPIIKTEKTDLKPLQDVMLDLLKAVNKQKLEVPNEFKVSNFKDVPLADLTEVEKKLDQSNKHLKQIAEKRGSTGGGGGESTLAFPLYANRNTTIAKAGAIKTITETDGTKTLTTTIDSTNPNNKTITEVWS